MINLQFVACVEYGGVFSGIHKDMLIESIKSHYNKQNMAISLDSYYAFLPEKTKYKSDLKKLILEIEDYYERNVQKILLGKHEYSMFTSDKSSIKFPNIQIEELDTPSETIFICK